MKYHSTFTACVALLACSLLPAQEDAFPYDIRGTNYTPVTSLAFNNVVAMIPERPPGALIRGQFNAKLVQAELGRMAKSGVNNIRLLPSFYGYIADRVGYMSCLKTLARLCHERNISITYQVWSGVTSTAHAISADGVTSMELWHELIGSSVTDPYNFPVLGGALFRSAARQQLFISRGGTIPPGEPWLASIFAEPGNELLLMSGDYGTWPYNLKPRIDGYLDAIARFFSADPDGRLAFASYDLFNEADATQTVPPAHAIQFIKATYDRITRIHCEAEMTIGWALDDGSADALDQLAVAAGVERTYLSFHSYSKVDRFASLAAARKSYADSQGLPLVCSEFHRADFTAGVLKYQLDTISGLGMGAQIWSVIQTNHFIRLPHGSYPVDGLYVPVQGATPGTLDFYVNNPADVQAFEDWTSGVLSAPPYTSLTVQDAAGNPVTTVTAGSQYDVVVSSSRVGDPVLLLASPYTSPLPPCFAAGVALAAGCVVIPGLGPSYVHAGTAAQVLGPLNASGVQLFTGVIAPAPSLVGQALAVTAYVGYYPSGDFNQNVGEITMATILSVQ